MGRVPEDGQDFHRERDGGEEERLFRAEGTASARRERQESWEVLEAQGIVSIGCDGEEIEVRAAKLGWGHIVQDLEFQSEESVVKWERVREPWTVWGRRASGSEEFGSSMGWVRGLDGADIHPGEGWPLRCFSLHAEIPLPAPGWPRT